MSETTPELEPSDPDQERVRRLLAAAPAPTMPPEVSARLDAVLAAESRRRAAGRAAADELSEIKGGFSPALGTGAGLTAGLALDPTETPASLAATPVTDRPAPVPDASTGSDPVARSASTGRWRRPAAIALVAAVTAASVGIATYTLSATAGLNEPTAASTVRLQSADLAKEAEAIAAANNLSAHLFSSAWRCAHGLTDGRITGITPVYVDGTPAYLVYTRTSGQNFVTVVTGCPGSNAAVLRSVRLG